jgi:beta-glucosidase
MVAPERMVGDETRSTVAPRDETTRAPLPAERKVAMLSGHDEWWTEAVPEWGLPAALLSDGPHGLRKVEGDRMRDSMTGAAATCFPTASAIGSSWDRELAREIGEAIAREARDQGVAVVLGPGVNIKRHPFGGRGFEYYSEDPLLSGEFATATIEGIQSLGVGTSLKHFAVNNQETNRMVVDAVVDERTLREIYLPAFELAVTRARPWTVMTAYNRLNGTYCSEHPWLLATLLRDEWGFDGVLVSDWGANNDRVAAVRAGLDLEMPGAGGIHDAAMLDALDRGALAEADVDACVDRIAALLAKAAATAATPLPALDLAAHHALARRAAADAAVLLTNVDDALPLADGASVAVIGQFAVSARYQGAGSSRVNPHRVDRALDEMRSIAGPAGGDVTFTEGYDDAHGLRPDLVDEAVAAAREAEVAVVFVGLPGSMEAEGADRSHLRLPEQHDRLVQAVCAANPRTVVVVSTGAPVAMPWVEQPAAIVLAHLGGEAVGGAVADVLYGRRGPGGRLAETYARQSLDLASDRWFPGSARQVQYREGLYVGYRWFETAGADVLFPFGHGLSYTTFEISDVALSAVSIADDETVQLSATVTNTGERDGAEVVQVYVRPPASVVHRPALELRAFEKVHLAPGARATVSCTLDRRAFAHWDVAAGGWRVCPGAYQVVVGRSVRDLVATIALDVRSDFVPSVSSPDAYRRLAPGGMDVDDDAFAAMLGRPVPATEPIRPFHRNSTVGDLGSTPVGALALAGLRAILARMVRGADADGGLGVTVDRGLVELPLRNLPPMTKGRIPLWSVDRLIQLANRVSRRR